MKEYYLLKNGEELAIRKGNENDSNELMEYVRNDSYSTNVLTINHELMSSLDAQRRAVKKNLDSSNELLLIGEVGKRIIGYLMFRLRNKPEIVHVGEVFISVASGYKEFGVNKLLLNHLLSWAKETGMIRKVNLRIPVDKKDEIEFFKQAGFKTEGIVRREFYKNGILLDAVLLGICVEPNADVIGFKQAT